MPGDFLAERLCYSRFRLADSLSTHLANLRLEGLMQRILVLGAGFAGLWSAVGAARKLDELGIGPEGVEVLVINRTGWHSIRVRNYEAVLNETLVPLGDVLDPIGVTHVEAEVTDIDLPRRTVACSIDGNSHAFPYDRLVFALGSRLVRPAIPGLKERAFDVDTYGGAAPLGVREVAARIGSGTWGHG